MTAEELQELFKKHFSELAENCTIDKGDFVVTVPLGKTESTLRELRDNEAFDFKMYMDFTIVDWMGREPRFDLVYHLYSVSKNARIRIKVGIDEGVTAPTVSHLWPVADWHEREMWEFYGVKFNGHPNLKRLFLYDEFKGHPLRKDYPYKKRQPRVAETFPSRPTQFQYEDLKIHRGD